MLDTKPMKSTLSQNQKQLQGVVNHSMIRSIHSMIRSIGFIYGEGKNVIKCNHCIPPSHSPPPPNPTHHPSSPLPHFAPTRPHPPIFSRKRGGWVVGGACKRKDVYRSYFHFYSKTSVSKPSPFYLTTSSPSLSLPLPPSLVFETPYHPPLKPPSPPHIPSAASI